LYLIHTPKVAKPSIREAWAAMERIKEAGLARSIGVSNFDEFQLEELMKTAKHVPVVNQVRAALPTHFATLTRLEIRSWLTHTCSLINSPRWIIVPNGTS
jgi:diketogulonate reductase-like aldo/keto reductase